jgi:hypothetical protein
LVPKKKGQVLEGGFLVIGVSERPKQSRSKKVVMLAREKVTQLSGTRADAPEDICAQVSNHPSCPDIGRRLFELEKLPKK